MEPDQIDVLASTMLRDFEEIQDSKETRLAGQFRSDIREADLRDRIDFDLTLVHTVPRAHLDVWTHPYPDAASNFPSANPFAQALGKNHEKVYTLWG